jgi:hypothetical protein
VKGEEYALLPLGPFSVLAEGRVIPEMRVALAIIGEYLKLKLAK